MAAGDAAVPGTSEDGDDVLVKKDIIEKIAVMQYPPNEYWITAGAGLVMHGVKHETRDIDMGCSSQLADLLIENGAEWLYLKDGSRRVVVDNIELFENWFADSIIMIDGLCVASLESIRKQKMALGRAKDWDDIRLIDAYREKEHGTK